MSITFCYKCQEMATVPVFCQPSGNGKTTLLNLIGCLNTPAGGTLTVADTDVVSLDRKQRASFRGRYMGFIFQNFNLMDYIYLRITQKEPFDILYLTPSITCTYNIKSKSCSLSPEILYTGITNLELRLKAGFLTGPDNSEFGEKQNDYRIELRMRYYFDAASLLN